MKLSVLTDPAAVRAAITAALVLDPVANTVLGSMLEGPPDELWCVVDASRPGVVAARSTPAFPVVLTPGWVADDAAGLASAISELPGLRAITGAIEMADAVAAAVAEHTGRSLADRRPERLYRIDELSEPEDVAGSSRAIGPGDGELLSEWVTAFSNEIHAALSDPAVIVDRLLGAVPPLARFWLDPAEPPNERPVAVAARRPVAAGSARIGPVYTPPAERGHGYAAAVTAVLTREILDEGAVPVLFTDANDPVPNRLYRRLGYYPVRDSMRIFFS